MLRNKTRVPTLTMSINLEVLAIVIKQKAIEVIRTGKGEVKRSLFAGDIILYTENPKESSKQLLEEINKFSKVMGYKINIKTQLHF